VATDFEAEGLLDGVDGEAREARKRLLEKLEADGVPLEELRQAAAEGRLALVPVERALTEGPRHTFAEVAEKSGLEPEFLTKVLRALGLPLPEPSERVYLDTDVEAARIVASFRAARIPDEEILEATRVLGRAMAQVVSANRTVIGRAFIQPGDTEYDIATRWSEVARELNPLLERVVTYVLRAQQIAQLRQDVSALSEFTGGSGVTPIAVAFADLAGFTRLGEKVATDELGSIAGRLTAMATDIARPPVRLVKMIGDAAMLVSVEAAALLAAVLDLVAAAEAEGEDFPELHAGLAIGDALARAGDWFGRPVNLASRITQKARAGSVLTTSEFRDAVGDDERFEWSRLAGRRRFRGISGEVELYRARYAEARVTGRDSEETVATDLVD
jgi:adenylate cyclase